MKALREGFTTGSCAAAAALASCLWQRDGACPERVGIVVPAGKTFAPEIIAHGGYVCGVIKDGGDDPDITTGSEVRARVRLMESDGGIRFLAGDGVGTITLSGMKLPVGEAAINPVPRRMIEQAVRQVFPARAAEVTVSIPGGEELAKRTFNPRLGVVGGLSVLGTTGVVRPMSEEALKETIRLELSVRKSQGAEEIGLVFGSQGETAAADALFPRHADGADEQLCRLCAGQRGRSWALRASRCWGSRASWSRFPAAACRRTANTATDGAKR